VPQRLCDEPPANPLPPPMACDSDQRQMGLQHPITLNLGKAHDFPALDGNDRVDAWSRQGPPGEVTICGVGVNPTLTLLANPPKRPMGTILEHNRGHWV